MRFVIRRLFSGKSITSFKYPQVDSLMLLSLVLLTVMLSSTKSIAKELNGNPISDSQSLISVAQFNKLVKKQSIRTKQIRLKQSNYKNLVTQVELLLNSSDTPELDRRYLLNQSIQHLRNSGDQKLSRQLLLKLNQVEHKYFTHLEDGNHKMIVPLFPIASAAKHLLITWDNEKYRQSAQTAIQQSESTTFADAVTKMTNSEEYLITLLKSNVFSMSQLNNAFASLQSNKYPVAFTWLYLKMGNLKQSLIHLENINHSSHQVNLLLGFAVSIAQQERTLFFKELLKHPLIFSLGASAVAKRFSPSDAFDLLFPYFENKALGGEASYQLSKILNAELINKLESSYPLKKPIGKTRILSTLNNAQNSQASLVAERLLSGGTHHE